MTIRKTVHLNNEQNKWLKAQVILGHYSGISELIRELIDQAQQGEGNTLPATAVIPFVSDKDDHTHRLIIEVRI